MTTGEIERRTPFETIGKFYERGAQGSREPRALAMGEATGLRRVCTKRIQSWMIKP